MPSESLRSPLVLAGEFPAADEDDWRALVAAVLRKSGHAEDADPVGALSSTTYDGITIRPLYTSGPDGAVPIVARQGAWDVRTRHRDPDPARTRVAALHDLETGARSLWLVLGDAGLPVAALGEVLEPVHLDIAPIVLDAGRQTREVAAAYLDLLGARKVAADEVRGSLGADPIGLHARTGADADLFSVAELASAFAAYPGVCVATVDGTVYHDAGASDAAEIGIATAAGVAYLRVLTDAGLSIDEALARVEFRFAVNADQFSSIAKLRAARQVWDRVAELSQGTGTQRQHAVTSAAIMTRHDPWVNLLRATIAGFSAAVGGADAITVLPFDDAIGLSDDFARRIARNTSAILHDESSLARVGDAAAGSWYVESLTAALADQAWDEFTAIERAGGPVDALDEIAARIEATRAARADDIAHRRAPLTGVTEYSLPDEAPLPRAAAPEPLSGGRLAPHRYAEAFEALRTRVEASQPRPAVFVAALGPFATHRARVAFATNLFNVGGFRVVVGAVEDFTDSDAAVACLCASDEVYGVAADEAVATLRAAGAAYLWSAGTVEVGGVDGRLFAGCDALDVLRTTLAAS